MIIAETRVDEAFERAGKQLIRTALPSNVAVIFQSLAVLNAEKQSQLAALRCQLGRREA